MDNDLFNAAIAVIGVPAVLVGYILLTERLIQALPERRQGSLRPWFWIAPALLFLIVFLIYPTLNTFVLSFMDAQSKNFIGLDNYAWFIQDKGTLEALRNSVLWVIFMTAGVVGLGLLIAILVDRVRYEPVAKSVIFLPLAISFVAAGVIWSFMYQYQDPSRPQTGTLNSLIGLIGLGPTRWTQEQPINNFSLIFIGVWMWTGFAMVILSAGLKGISPEVLEAARVDGMSEFRILWAIVLPLVRPAVAALAVLVFTFVWNDYFWALVLVQSDAVRPVTAGLQALRGMWLTSWQLISAAAILAALPPVFLFFLMQRQLVAGLTFGATRS